MASAKTNKLTAKSRNDRCVQGTNDSSVLSKCSMATAGYFDDDYLKYFVAKLTRRSPIIHRGYYIRAMAIQKCLDTFLSFKQKQTMRQIISLGAGFDAAYFRLKASQTIGTDVYIEIDFLPLCHRKAALIRASPRLCDLIGLKPEDIPTPNQSQTPIVIDTPSYKLLGIDLSNIFSLNECLKRTFMDPMPWDIDKFSSVQCWG